MREAMRGHQEEKELANATEGNARVNFLAILVSEGCAEIAVWFSLDRFTGAYSPCSEFGNARREGPEIKSEKGVIRRCSEEEGA